VSEPTLSPLSSGRDRGGLGLSIADCISHNMSFIRKAYLESSTEAMRLAQDRVSEGIGLALINADNTVPKFKVMQLVPGGA